MSYEHGSTNYQVRLSEGWVEGPARYANEEPHHGPGYTYVTMHNPKREKLLARIIEGRQPGRKAIETKAYIIDRFPILSDEPEVDYATAEKSGEVRAYLVRGVGYDSQEVPLPPVGKRGFYIYANGWDHLEQREDEWVAEYFEATLVREPMWP